MSAATIPLKINVLHHAGAADLRIPSTVALVQAQPGVVVCVFSLREEIVQLQAALTPRPMVYVTIRATDTVEEVAATLPWVHAGDTLYISTEPGHLARAVMIARILYWGRGVTIIPWPSAPGAYRSPWLRTVRDFFRAWWRRVRA